MTAQATRITFCARSSGGCSCPRSGTGQDELRGSGHGAGTAAREPPQRPGTAPAKESKNACLTTKRKTKTISFNSCMLISCLVRRCKVFYSLPTTGGYKPSIQNYVQILDKINLYIIFNVFLLADVLEMRFV